MILTDTVIQPLKKVPLQEYSPSTNRWYFEASFFDFKVSLQEKNWPSKKQKQKFTPDAPFSLPRIFIAKMKASRFFLHALVKPKTSQGKTKQTKV